MGAADKWAEKLFSTYLSYSWMVIKNLLGALSLGPAEIHSQIYEV